MPAKLRALIDFLRSDAKQAGPHLARQPKAARAATIDAAGPMRAGVGRVRPMENRPAA
jgi:hypothetical protein